MHDASVECVAWPLSATNALMVQLVPSPRTMRNSFPSCVDCRHCSKLADMRATCASPSKCGNHLANEATAALATISILDTHPRSLNFHFPEAAVAWQQNSQSYACVHFVISGRCAFTLLYKHAHSTGQTEWIHQAVYTVLSQAQQWLTPSQVLRIDADGPSWFLHLLFWVTDFVSLSTSQWSVF